MKFSLDWLRAHVDLPESGPEVAEHLAAAGFPADGMEAWGADTCLDVDITSNRPDCMSHVGLARELAARLGRDLKRPAATPPRSAAASGDLARIRLQDADLCSRYTAVVLTGVKVGPSPDWLEDRLASIGQRSINNLVDVTNFVLHELGQPLHAFDLDRLEERTIIVRRAATGESLKTLDGTQRTLSPSHLVIADGRQPVALAGIMGGENTEISSSTTRVLLESACFDAVNTRRSARSLGLHTDASHRFERGTDPGGTLAAALRAATLILETAGGELASGEIDLCPGGPRERRVHLSLSRAATVIGLQLDRQQVIDSLEGLGFASRPAADLGADGLEILVPSWRGDVERDVDIIEEIARLVGYDAIPATLPSYLTGETGRPRPGAAFDRARQIAAAAGYSEAICFPMSNRKEQEPFALGGAGSLVEIDNPMAAPMSIMRASLVPGLLDGLAQNRNRGIEDIRLFEVGRVFSDAADSVAGREPAWGGPAGVRLPVERTVLAAAGCGASSPAHWSGAARPLDLFDLKGVAEGVAARLFSSSLQMEPVAPGEAVFLAPGQGGWLVMGGRRLGFAGGLAHELAAARDLSAAVFIMEIDLTEAPPRPIPRPTQAPPRQPAVGRDLALLVGSNISYRQLEETIVETAGELLESLDVFDRYAGPPVPAGQVSLAVRMVFRHPERTLTTDEVQEVQDRVVRCLRSNLNVGLRDA